jgi:transposase-like protein
MRRRRLPLSDAKRQQVIDLAKTGRGRNEIAREVGVSGRTVSVIADKEGLSFDRSQTVQATEARKVDAKARRTTLSLDMLGDLETARLRIIEAATARDFQLTAQGLDALTRAYVNLQKLEPDDGGLGEARGLLGKFFAAVESVADLEPGMPVEVADEQAE